MRKFVIIIFSFLLGGCLKSMEFPQEEAFIEYEYGDYGPDLIGNLYPKIITLYGNGKGELSMLADEGPRHTITFEIEDEAVRSLQETIEEVDLFSIPEDLSEMDVVDGGYEYLTVFTTDENHTIGGSNPNNESLDRLSEEIFQAIPDEVLPSFNEEIEKYQKEKDLRG